MLNRKTSGYWTRINAALPSCDWALKSKTIAESVAPTCRVHLFGEVRRREIKRIYREPSYNR